MVAVTWTKHYKFDSRKNYYNTREYTHGQKLHPLYDPVIIPKITESSTDNK